VCRLAASGDAEICARTFHNITDENLPMPMMHVTARGAYAIVMTAALRHAGLPYHAYEFNAALTRALETEQAERRWLAGEDIFSDTQQDPVDAMTDARVQPLYEHAFSET
jgi:hypothetical protein